MNVHTINDLKQLQALPLDIKVRMTQTRIKQWVDEFSTDGVYVSFSGGKDSTVLLNIVRELYPEIPAVFVDTGLEYPEIREFVKTFDNVTWLKPKMNFRQVIEKYGYPFISKEVSHKVGCVAKNPNSKYKRYFDVSEKSMFNCSKWSFLLNAPFKLEASCCYVMKKTPIHSYEKEKGRKVMTAIMASESNTRTQSWLQNGCNAFDLKRPVSNPMSFWTEQDVLQYIKNNNLPIASVYGDIVPVDNQISLFDTELKTTGCNRTGCMFCGFGCHMESNPNRFEKMKETHPKQYEYIMRDWDKGGLGYKKVIDWINEHGNMNIKY